MNATAKGSYEYLKNAVLTAQPEQLHLMLIDGAIRFTMRGIDAIGRGAIEEMFNAFERAQQIVIQMRAGLRREVSPQLVDQMAALYNFMYHRLVEASMQRSAAAAEEALRILRHQRQTWELLIRKLAETAPETASTAASPHGAPTPGASTPRESGTLCFEG